MIAAYRRRKRLEIDSVIERSGRPNLKRYKDPEEERYYIGMGRWDPFMIESIANELPFGPE